MNVDTMKEFLSAGHYATTKWDLNDTVADSYTNDSLTYRVDTTDGWGSMSPNYNWISNATTLTSQAISNGTISSAWNQLNQLHEGYEAVDTEPAPDGEMKMYDLEIIETRKQPVKILAATYKEAVDIANEMYDNGQFQNGQVSNYDIV